MPRPRPRFLHRQVTQHGRVAWYFRRGKGRRVRIRSPYGTPEFEAEYEAALGGARPLPAPRSTTKSGSLDWLIERYRSSAAWLALSAATRKQREAIFRQVSATAGGKAFTDVTRQTIVAGRDRRAATPFQARHFVNAMRALFAFAVEASYVEANPCDDVRIIKPRTKGFPVWDDSDIQAFERRWPRGTRERVMFDIFLYTGLRRGDAARLGKQHVRNGIIRINTEKSGEEIRVTIPILPELQRTLDAGPVGELAFIAASDGSALTKETIGNYFREACRAAGINKSAHGLRKAAATHAANNGATVAQLEAIFGWRGGRMASHYTQSADREALATGAITKLSREAKS